MPFGTIVQRRTPTLFAGRLRHKINIAVLSDAQDSSGGFSLGNTLVYANVWASVEALTAKDSLAANEFVSQVSHQIVIRFIGAAPSWFPLTNYVGNALVKDSNGNLQQAQSGGGTSGATAPLWNATVNGTTQDGDPSTGVVWKNLGIAPLKTGIRAGMLVLHDGHVYDVQAAQNPDGRNKMLILLCVEINDSNQQAQSTGAPGSFAAGNSVNDIDGGGF